MVTIIPPKWRRKGKFFQSSPFALSPFKETVVTTKTCSTIVGIFQNATQALQAVRTLKQDGFAESDIGVLTPHEEARIKMANAKGPHVGVGAGIGAAVSVLIGLGIPEQEARYYAGQLKAGATLVTVKAEGRCDNAWSILQCQG
jgi:hypothetical protein